MKPGERPPAPSNDGRLLDGTLGSDPVRQGLSAPWLRLVDLMPCGRNFEHFISGLMMHKVPFYRHHSKWRQINAAPH